MPRVDEIKVFCSYSHQDRPLRDELVKHLELLRQAMLIQTWHDGELTGGQDWQQEIENHLRDAHVILLLVSIDFLNSSFVREHELPVALERHKRGDALVIPVIMRPVSWAQSGLDFLQTLPDGLKPVILWAPQDLAYVNVCEGLFAAVMVWQGRKVPSRPLPAPSTSVRRRVVDLALSRRVPVGKATILAVMVRRVGEGGLRAVLEADPSLGLAPETVESSNSFPLEFPRAPDGKLSSLDLTIGIETEDFACRAPQKTLPVPAKGDSAVCVFLLEAQRTGPLVVVVNISNAGKMVLTRVLRSEGVAEAAFQPAVEEVPCLDIGEEPEPTLTSVQPVSYATPSFPSSPSIPAAPPPEPVAYQPAPPSAPAARKPFLVNRTAAMLASALLLFAVLGAWYVNRGPKPAADGAVALNSPPPDAVATGGGGPGSSPSPGTPPTAGGGGGGPAPSAQPPVASAQPPVTSAAPPDPVASSPQPVPATPAPAPSTPAVALPANYQLCAFASGMRILSIRGFLSIAQLGNGLQARCGYTGTGQTYDVTIQWQLSGVTRNNSSQIATVAAGNAVSVASSGPQWAYTGPLTPGVISVTVRSVRRSDGRENSWTGTAQLAP